MINLNDARNDAERLALTLFRAMETGDLLETISDICTEDFVWANSGLPTLYGQKAVRELMTRGGFRNEITILQEQTHFSADLIHIASDGDVVFTERIDHHWDAAGRDLMTPHIAGVIELRNGRICALRDFYDVACYQQQPTDIQPDFELHAFQARMKNGS